VISLATDEDFDRAIVRGLLKQNLDLDIVDARDWELGGAPDPEVFAWAADQDRILPTHDVTTMTRHAYDRIASGLPCPGVIVAPQTLAIGRAVEDLYLFSECSLEGEWKGQVRYLPL
jgi:hypothetical protein